MFLDVDMGFTILQALSNDPDHTLRAAEPRR